MKGFRLGFVFIELVFSLAINAEGISPEFFTVEVSATATLSPAQLTLHWLADTNASEYSISRKLLVDTNWTPLANLPAQAAEFIDPDVTIGQAYEYQILKTTSLGVSGSGYIYAGVEANPIEQRGSIILLIDSTWKTSLAPELKSLQQDLIGDGWSVIARYVSPSASVLAVKDLIKNLYSTDPSHIKALFLFGHIPVPYSGNYTADSHENHSGAWPADAFYGDMDGTWTDSTVNNSNAEKPWNHNVPGDGKFDQSEIPSDLELEVGRVDLSNLTCFSNKTPSRDELALLRQYLNKDHAFRHGELSLPRRGLICYNFEDDMEGLRSTPLRNFAPLFGPAGPTVTVPWGSFFSTLDTDGFLFAYGAGGGSYYTCAGIGSSDDFAINDVKAVFTFFFGSYFGDWDNESNFLRAALGSTSYTLASAWAGRPHWFVHHMALGETIGYSTKISQNNGMNRLYQPPNLGTRGVHVSLMGDPTLRLHPFGPPAGLAISQSSPGFSLTWTQSSDPDVLGYIVYRAPAEEGPFTRISGPIALSSTSFKDPDGLASSVYMVRALKLETAGSGSYYNLSQGIFARPYPLPDAPSDFKASATASGVTVTWRDNAINESGFYLYRKVEPAGAIERIASVGPNVSTFQDMSVAAGVSYSYTISAYNVAGEAYASDEINVVVPATATASFVSLDHDTAGSWKGKYGAEGYNILEDSFSYPSYVNVLPSGQSSWVWEWNTSEQAALERALDSTRLAACWYAFSPLEIQFSFNDTAPHRVTFYFLDWDRAGRIQTVDLIASDTADILSTQTISDFQDGLYATWDIKGRVSLRLTPVSGNAVLSGVFFDSPLPAVTMPMLTPAGGKFTNSVEISMSSATPGCEIRFTTDGTTPSSSSQIYVSPLTLTNSATVKARAFKPGMNPSPATTGTYTISKPAGEPVAKVVFNGINPSRQGSWEGSIGTEGYAVFADSQSLPSYLTINFAGKSDWVWEYSTDDPRALQRRTDTTRMASCWYGAQAFEVTFNFKDQQAHRLNLYCLDWDFADREQTVEILDLATGQVLHTWDLINFGNGVYLDYTITGPVIARFTKIRSFNAVLSGFFVDRPTP
jgi:hypothetical protein